MARGRRPRPWPGPALGALRPSRLRRAARRGGPRAFRSTGAGGHASSAAPTGRCGSSIRRAGARGARSSRRSRTAPTRAARRGARAPTSSASPRCAPRPRQQEQAALVADPGGRLLEERLREPAVVGGRGAPWAVPDEAPILPGITRALLIELAGAVELRRPAPGDLAGRETWLVSALHGIRAVTGWVGGPEPGEAPRAATWQRRLESSRCNQRWLIPDERRRSRERTATPRRSAADAHSWQ